MTRSDHEMRAWRVAACVLITVLAGCGQSGHPAAGEIDVRTLDVGSYAVDRHSYDQNPHDKSGLLEGMRMTEAVVPSFRIDPSLNFGVNAGVDLENATTSFLSSADLPVLDRNEWVTGAVTLGSDKPGSGPDVTAVRNLVLRFPDPETAEVAARELDGADFAVAPDLNRKLTLPKYPDAYIHYRPGVPNVGAFLAHNEFVVAPFIERPTADEQDLLGWVRKTFDAELPALDKFQPTPQTRLGALQVDPDGLLARVVVRDRGKRTPDPSNFALYRAPALVAAASDEAATQRLVDDTGADAVALADGDLVIRARDAAAAPRLLDGLIAGRGGQYDPADTVSPPIPGVRCLALNATGDPNHQDKFRCYLSYKRYVARVGSNETSDLKLKVSAQYALLANSL